MDRLRTLDFRVWLWLVVAVFVVHELEEWNILSWYEAYWTNVDPETMTPRIVRTFLVAACALFALWAGAVMHFFSVRAATHLILAPFIVIVFGHAFLHAYWTMANGAYAPGVVTSLLLIIPGTTLVVLEAVRRELMAKWVAALLIALALGQLIGTRTIPNRVPDGGFPHLKLIARALELVGS